MSAGGNRDPMPRTAVSVADRLGRTNRSLAGICVTNPPGSAGSAVVRTVPESRRKTVKPAGKREELFAELQPLVRRLIQRFGEDAETRRDLEGEVYYRFCMLLDAYDPSRGVPLRPYLIRQLSASVYTYARQGWRRQKKETNVDLALVDGLCTDPADPSRDWDHRIVMDGIVDALPHLISGLPDRQRRVLIWRYYDGLEFEEIAQLLDIKEASVRSLLRHAVAKLRNAFGCSGPHL